MGYKIIAMGKSKHYALSLLMIFSFLRCNSIKPEIVSSTMNRNFNDAEVGLLDSIIISTPLIYKYYDSSSKILREFILDSIKDPLDCIKSLNLA